MWHANTLKLPNQAKLKFLTEIFANENILSSEFNKLCRVSRPTLVSLAIALFHGPRAQSVRSPWNMATFHPFGAKPALHACGPWNMAKRKNLQCACMLQVPRGQTKIFGFHWTCGRKVAHMCSLLTTHANLPGFVASINTRSLLHEKYFLRFLQS